MNRGDVALLVLWCVVVFFVYRFFEVGSLTTATVAMVAGGAVFAIRLYLARRSFR